MIGIKVEFVYNMITSFQYCETSGQEAHSHMLLEIFHEIVLKSA